MPNPTTIDDIEAGWRPLTDQETVNAQALLADAWAELLARVPLLDVRLAAGTLASELIVRVVRAMVLRVLRNPGGYRAETVGPYSYTRDSGQVTGLYLDDYELALLSPVAAASGDWAGSVPYSRSWPAGSAL